MGDKIHDLPLKGMQEYQDMSALEAIQIISAFDKIGWSDLKEEDIEVSKISGGYSNTLWLCQKSSGHQSCSSEKLIIRRYGGNMVKDSSDWAEFINTEVTEVMIFYHLSVTGLGPKLYGVFSGGRVEEYIEGHTLTPEEAMDPMVKKEIAINMARFHSSDLPLPRPGRCSIEFALESYNKFRKQNRESFIHNQILIENGFDTKYFARIPFDHELHWVRSAIDQVGFRNVFIVMDTNFLNCLIRDKVEDGQLRSCLIDYETSRYGARGIDIGGHFIDRMFEIKDQVDKRNNYPYPDESERREFIQEYLKETKKLGYIQDFDETAFDSVEHVLTEAAVAGLSKLLLLCVILMNEHEMLSKKDLVLMKLMPGAYEEYLLQKSEFLTKNPSLAL